MSRRTPRVFQDPTRRVEVCVRQHASPPGRQTASGAASRVQRGPGLAIWPGCASTPRKAMARSNSRRPRRVVSSLEGWRARERPRPRAWVMVSASWRAVRSNASAWSDGSSWSQWSASSRLWCHTRCAASNGPRWGECVDVGSEPFCRGRPPAGSVGRSSRRVAGAAPVRRRCGAGGRRRWAAPVGDAGATPGGCGWRPSRMARQGGHNQPGRPGDQGVRQWGVKHDASSGWPQTRRRACAAGGPVHPLKRGDPTESGLRTLAVRVSARFVPANSGSRGRHRRRQSLQGIVPCGAPFLLPEWLTVGDSQLQRSPRSIYLKFKTCNLFLEYGL
jgi:hypothetical protein